MVMCLSIHQGMKSTTNCNDNMVHKRCFSVNMIFLIQEYSRLFKSLSFAHVKGCQ